MKTYVVHYFNEDYPPASMYKINASCDEEAMKIIFDLSETVTDVYVAAQDTLDKNSGEFYMVYNVDDDKVIFEQ